MDQLEVSAKTVDDALRIALARMNATMDDVNIVILDEGKKGFLGRGARDAVVRVERLEPEAPAPEAERPGGGATPAERPQGRSGQPRRGGSGNARERSDRSAREGDRPAQGRGGRGRGSSRADLDEPAPRLTDDAFTRPGGGGPSPAAPPPRSRGGRSGGDRPPRANDTAGNGEPRAPRPPRERRARREENEPYVEPNIDSPAVDLACQTIDDMLRILDIRGDITIRAPETPGDGLGMALAVVDISGDDLGLLIGRRGDTLASLQYIVNLIVSRTHEGTHSAVTIDVEQYRKRRELQLVDLAARMADLVKRRGSAITLEPMTPAERRIIHVTLADDPELETNSIGEGENRKVVISARR